MDNQKLLSRFERCESDRRNVEAQWDDIRALVAPYRGDFYLKSGNTELAVDWRENRNVYDMTAIDAASDLSANISGKLTGMSNKWFSLRFRSDEMNEDKEAKGWLEDCEERVYQALLDSNFAVEAAKVYTDLVHWGTAGIVEEIPNEMDWEGVDFQAIPIKELFFEEDTRGKPINLFRRHYWSAAQIVDKFGEKGTPKAIKERAEIPGAGQDREQVIFCIFKRRSKQDADISKPLGPLERPYGWKYILKDTGETLGDEGGYYEMPCFITRWSITSDSQWGHGPSHVALPTIKGLNKQEELEEEALEKIVDPTIMVSEKAVISNLLLGPGEVNVVRDADGVRPFESNARFDVAFQKAQDKREQIKNCFLIDRLELKESPQMTALETSVRYEMMQQRIGSPAYLIQTEFLTPSVMRTFNIMARMRQLKPMPDVVAASGSELDIEFHGPINRGQKRDEINVIDEVVQTALVLAQAKPQALDNIDEDEVIRKKHALLSAPSDILRSRDNVDQERTQRQEQMQQEQMLAGLEQGASALDKFGKGAKALTEAENVTPITQ